MMKGQLFGSAVVPDEGGLTFSLILADGTTLPGRRCICPECPEPEAATPLTQWEDMGDRVRYRLTCPNRHTWEILP